MIKKACIILFALSVLSPLCGQTFISPVDTVNIFKDKAGVSFKIYMSTWFFGYGFRHSWSWMPSRENHQDSLVIENGPPHYFKVYNRRHQLLFEGGSKTPAGELEGDVICYYKSGIKKRIEHWDHQYTKDTCNESILFNEAPGPEGTWLYFRPDGSLKKKAVYSIKVTSCEPLRYHAVKTIIGYQRNGRQGYKRARRVRM